MRMVKNFKLQQGQNPSAELNKLFKKLVKNDWGYSTNTFICNLKNAFWQIIYVYHERWFQ